MPKKRKKPSNKLENAPRPDSGKPGKEERGTPADRDEDKADYGGFPDIDLKKNLGCG
ncbi:MAG: hypothetical protein WA874_14730 [Chryseosolibacter sp.]